MTALAAGHGLLPIQALGAVGPVLVGNDRDEAHLSEQAVADLAIAIRRVRPPSGGLQESTSRLIRQGHPGDGLAVSARDEVIDARLEES